MHEALAPQAMGRHKARLLESVHLALHARAVEPELVGNRSQGRWSVRSQVDPSQKTSLSLRPEQREQEGRGGSAHVVNISTVDVGYATRVTLSEFGKPLTWGSPEWRMISLSASCHSAEAATRRVACVSSGAVNQASAVASREPNDG